MNKVELTEKAKTICKENYDKNCGGCPLRRVCVTTIGPGYDGLNKWTESVNQAAEELKPEEGQMTLF